MILQIFIIRKHDVPLNVFSLKDGLNMVKWMMEILICHILISKFKC